MTNEKIEKLKKLLEVANDGLSKADFIESFKKVVDQILKLEAKLIEKINSIFTGLKTEFETLKSDAQIDLDKTKNQLIEKAEKMFEEERQNLNFIQDKVRRIKEGKDGYTPQKGVDYFDGQQGQPGKDADEEKIIKEVINKIVLPDYMVELEKLRTELLEEIRQNKRLGGGGFSKIAMESKFVDDETPTGTVNGINKIFTIANLPNPPVSVKVYLNGTRRRITEDYTLSGKTITFNDAPEISSIILCDYRQ